MSLGFTKSVSMLCASFLTIGSLLISCNLSAQEIGIMDIIKHAKDKIIESISIKTNDLIYQQGSDKEAVWGHIGYLPRVKKAKQMKVVMSKKGITIRAELTLTSEDIQDYASYLVDRFDAMQELQKGQISVTQSDGTYTVPFKVLDKKMYEEYINTIENKVRSVANAGYQANLDLLKSFYGPNIVEKEDGTVILNMVYPASMEKAAFNPTDRLSTIPAPGTYTTHILENRKTKYAREPDSYIFAGFPALWFAGAVGLHGPIAYTTDGALLEGIDLDPKNRPDKKVTKRWQLLRAPVSHGCIRLEHSLEIRQMMPANDEEAKKVTIKVERDFDRAELQDGRKVSVGVKYYWMNASETPSEKKWKDTFYGKNAAPADLYEYPYYMPETVQVVPLTGTNKKMNPMATADSLIKIPFN